jgi:ABC-type branched-subunit amino acid transport system substrate-binding protein
MRRRKSALLAVVVAGLAFAIAACGGDDDEAGGEAQLDLVIGDSVPLTGDLADFGPPGQKAADIAAAQINDAIQQAGVDHTVNLVHEDNETNPQAAVQAARKMVQSDGASCITGAWASADTIPTAQSLSIPEGVLQISPASTSDEITGLDDDGLVNRTAPPDSFQGPTLANYVDQGLGGAEGKTVNIGARNDAYGTGLADAFSAGWESLGGSIGQEVIYDPEQPSYNSEAGQIIQGNPDGIVIIDFPETFIKVGPALVRTGNFDAKKMFFTDGLASSDLPSAAGREATEGARGTAPGAPDEDRSQIAFDGLFKQSDPKNVGRFTFDVQNFDAVILCYLSAVAAGSTEGPDMAEVVRDVSAPPGEKFTFEQLADAIVALRDGEEIDYDGPSGAIDLDEAGDATAGVYDILQFRKGALDSVDEVTVATPEE